MRVALIVVTLSLVMVSGVMAKGNKHNGLPPGLEKRVASGKGLPPGWQKKMRKGDIIDKDIYEHAPVIKRDPDKGLVEISIGGKIVEVFEHSREIVEILTGK